MIFKTFEYESSKLCFQRTKNIKETKALFFKQIVPSGINYIKVKLDATDHIILLYLSYYYYVQWYVYYL